MLDKPDKLYFEIQKTLFDKFKKPKKEDVVWGESYKIISKDKRDINNALWLNEVELRSNWYDTISQQKRIIFLNCSNQNGKIFIRQLNSDQDYLTSESERERKKKEQNF